jgi:hypothetical protein
MPVGKQRQKIRDARLDEQGAERRNQMRICHALQTAERARKTKNVEIRDQIGTLKMLSPRIQRIRRKGGGRAPSKAEVRGGLLEAQKYLTRSRIVYFGKTPRFV